MEFEHNGRTYRLYRGVGTKRWMLLGELTPQSGSWRLLDSFDPLIHDSDIIDYSKNFIDRKNINE